ncbi:MAG: polysaccharide lyase family 7 protein, partial [Pseudonocardiales bacterium]|nr:polysaccharide lyase family 7 protein [Pseudonocardiales bacterium]
PPTVVVVLLFVTLLGGIVFAFAACQNRRPSPLPPPGPPSRIDLSGWKLSIPVPNKKGTPTLLEPAYTVDPWMVADPTGGLMFWAPANGVSTENSEHPRTELNSLTTFNAGQNARTLRASVTLLQVPEDGEGIILGQIHGTDDISSVPYVMLRYQKDQVKVVVKQVQDRDDHINYTLLKDVPLNTRFDFTISDLGTGEMTFAATRGGKTEEVQAPVPAPFMGAPVRFQAGDYQQADRPGGAKDGGRVIFHQLAEAPGAAP